MHINPLCWHWCLLWHGVLTWRPCGRQVTLLNFLRYNVGGGGDSALYGVEGPGYYLRNAAVNLNLVLPLALAAPLTTLFLLLRSGGGPFLLPPKPYARLVSLWGMLTGRHWAAVRAHARAGCALADAWLPFGDARMQ
jgi:hypothetical protein